MLQMLNRKKIKEAAILAFIGFYYLIFVMITDMGIPCPFRFITHLYCPGCGLTRMIVNLVRLDFYGAFRSNMFIFCAWPVIMGMLFIKKQKAQTAVAAVLIILAVAWAVLRNIFPYFAPQ